MDKIFALNASSTPPAVPTTYEIGYPQEGVISTELGAYWHYMVTQELYNAIVALGITPDKAMVNQLATGLTAMLTSINSLTSNLNTVSANSMPIGALLPWPGVTPPSGFIKANGVLLPRSGNGSFPLLTAAVLGGGLNTIAEASWSQYPGRFSLGDNSTTIRVPDGRGLTLKGHHDGSGNFTTNTSRLIGSYESDDNKAHYHINGVTAFANGDGVGPFGASWDGPSTKHDGDSGPTTKYGNTSTVGGPETLIRNISILWCLRAY